MINIRKYGNCEICGKNTLLDEHHKIKRSKQAGLIKCKYNIANICLECHYSIHHQGKGRTLDQYLKLTFQNFLESIFDKEYFTVEEVGQALEITYKASYSLCKTLKAKEGIFYQREDIIRSAMGGTIITEEEGKEIYEQSTINT